MPNQDQTAPQGGADLQPPPKVEEPNKQAQGQGQDESQLPSSDHGQKPEKTDDPKTSGAS